MKHIIQAYKDLVQLIFPPKNEGDEPTKEELVAFGIILLLMPLFAWMIKNSK